MDDLKEILAAATPGPWNASPSIPEDGYECFWIRARKPMGLATRGFSVVNIGAADGPQDTTRKANARLIAMAPDLAAEVLRLREREAKLTQELNHVLARMNAAAVEIEHAERLACAALKAKGTE